MNNNGKMEFIKDTKATKEKIEFDIFCLENAINEDIINWFLFRDSEDVKENSKKIVKKDKKDKK